MSYIKGTYIEDIFSNQKNGYLVGLIRIKESSEEDKVNKVITFTGIFDELIYKATYKMEGDFVTHPKYGNQFVVKNYEIILPTEKEELIDFLSSDLFPIGEKTAERIVDKLGKDAIKLIQEDKSNLSGIPRLSKEKINKIAEILDEYQTTSHIVLELTSMGFTTKTAIAIMKRYNNNTMNIINNNIYDIKEDIDITFSDLDKIARNIGYQLNDERRLQALTINIMNVLTFNKGDTYLYFDEMFDSISKYTDNITTEEFTYILLKLSKLKRIIIDKDKYFLYSMYEDEKYIAKRLVELNNKKRRKLPKLETLIRGLELVTGFTYDNSQKDAITKALNNNFTIITGGPGTGKTTIIKCIVKLLIEINGLKPDKLALLAPTGRAARKLMDITSLKSSTIHKYLSWDKEANEFQIGEYNPNKESYIIVDEASMIDTTLMSCLLKGITKDAKLILVGDYHQLPSVSQGQVLKDLIDCDCFDVVKLNNLYRQTEDSFITTLAYEIKNKSISENFLSKYDDYNFVTCSNESILLTIKDIVLRAIEKGYTEKDIQILSPMYKSSSGIDSLNKMLKDIFNPKSNDKNEVTSGEITYREGDKVLQLVNDSDNCISNGDIGYIESITTNKSKKTEVIINFDSTRVTYTAKDFINFTHGYAISVHKSQGGEFKMVIMLFSKSFNRMLYNKLIYTAVTRAKEKLILVGSPEAFLYGVNNNYIDTRKTNLLNLIKNMYI